MRKIELGLCKAEEFLGWARPLRPGFAERHRYKKNPLQVFRKERKKTVRWDRFTGTPLQKVSPKLIYS
jgi:hypothetical protein